jgi:O-antigen/teichoic acid export membrane protein
MAEEAMGAYALVVGAYAVVYLTSYIYAVVIARLLGPSSYSALASLLAIGAIVSIGIGGPFQQIVTRYVAADTALGLDARARYLVRKALMFGAYASGAALLISLALSWPIKSWLDIATLPPVVLLSLFMAVWLVYPVTAGAVQGAQKFRMLSLAFVLGAVTRVVVGIVLVELGMKVTGAMIAEVASAAVAVAVLGEWMRRWLGRGPAEGRLDLSHRKRFATTVIVSSACLVAFIYMDVFLVRGLIGGAQAGYYAGAQKLGTVMYFIPGIVAVVLFPRVSANYASGITSWRMFARVEAAVAAMCGCVAVFFVLFPEWSIKVVFGSKYLPGSSLVPIFALAMFCFSLLPVCVQFFLATDRRAFMYILVSGVIVEILAILIFHHSTKQVAWSVALVSVAMVVLIGLYTWSEWNAHRRGMPIESLPVIEKPVTS